MAHVFSLLKVHVVKAKEHKMEVWPNYSEKSAVHIQLLLKSLKFCVQYFDSVPKFFLLLKYYQVPQLLKVKPQGRTDSLTNTKHPHRYPHDYNIHKSTFNRTLWMKQIQTIIDIFAYFKIFFHFQSTHLNGQWCSAGSKPVVTLLPRGHSV